MQCQLFPSLSHQYHVLLLLLQRKCSFLYLCLTSGPCVAGLLSPKGLLAVHRDPLPRMCLGKLGFPLGEKGSKGT